MDDNDFDYPDSDDDLGLSTPDDSQSQLEESPVLIKKKSSIRTRKKLTFQ